MLVPLKRLTSQSLILTAENNVLPSIINTPSISRAGVELVHCLAVQAIIVSFKRFISVRTVYYSWSSRGVRFTASCYVSVLCS